MNEPRQSEHHIDAFFLERWSPRAFLPVPITNEDLASLFEAARWAPSSYNNQPWRFLYAKRETPAWPLFFDLLAEGNRAWVKDASALVLVLSNTRFDYNGKSSITHSFDAGAAWGSLALQAWLKGYATHGMEGFDYAAARIVLEIPGDFTVEAMIAIGKLGPKESLPEALQKLEAPNSRRALSQSVVEGKFTDRLVHLTRK